MQTTTLLQSSSTQVSQIDPSLFLSDAEIKRIMLLDLDLDSMNEFPAFEPAAWSSAGELEMMAA